MFTLGLYGFLWSLGLYGEEYLEELLEAISSSRRIEHGIL